MKLWRAMRGTGRSRRSRSRNLFALSDLRQVDGHRKDVDNMLSPALERFRIDLSVTRSGWGLVLDDLYDQLLELLRQVHRTIAETLWLG